VADGIIAYKTFGSNYAAAAHWRIEPGSVLDEVVNPNRINDCGCGINVATLDWMRQRRQETLDGTNPIWKCLIRWAWLPGVVVPYDTDGKIRASRVELVETVG